MSINTKEWFTAPTQTERANFPFVNAAEGVEWGTFWSLFAVGLLIATVAGIANDLKKKRL